MCDHNDYTANIEIDKVQITANKNGLYLEISGPGFLMRTKQFNGVPVTELMKIQEAGELGLRLVPPK